jgi:hypothetical protein
VTALGPAARRIARLTGLAVRDARAVGAQHGYQHFMVTLAGGQRAFAKVATEDDTAAGDTGTDDTGTDDTGQLGGAFAAEANGLRWLAEADAVPVPDVLAVTGSALVISMIPPGRASPSAAFGFGAELARLHAAGAPGFGAPWRGVIASLPLDNRPLDSKPRAGPPDWPSWYAARRVLPYLRTAVDRDAGRPGRAAQPHPRRLLGRERTLVRRPGLAHRPGRPRRPPGDRPGPAGLVRRARPGPHPGRLQRHGAARGGLAGPDPVAPAASPAGARLPVRRVLRRRGPDRGPGRPVPLGAPSA